YLAGAAWTGSVAKLGDPKVEPFNVWHTPGRLGDTTPGHPSPSYNTKMTIFSSNQQVQSLQNIFHRITFHAHVDAFTRFIIVVFTKCFLRRKIT
uniref:Uncharacterized protein n=1 Tax=Romanomermis culicivorax TaxID=13658 RepID=A0A915J9V4_ROMCU